ncbi:hypothetical protein PF003_g21047 [Phytophthora fragariae]|nr:hypothetical protein PF003_g21047 [Phytophthora fragariae]
MVPVYDVEKDRRGLRRGDCDSDRGKRKHLAETINEDENPGAVLSISMQPEDKVHTQGDHGSAAIGRDRCGVCFDCDGLSRWHA